MGSVAPQTNKKRTLSHCLRTLCYALLMHLLFVYQCVVTLSIETLVPKAGNKKGRKNRPFKVQSEYCESGQFNFTFLNVLLNFFHKPFSDFITRLSHIGVQCGF